MHLQTVIEAIELETGFKAMQLPLLADYFINLGYIPRKATTCDFFFFLNINSCVAQA